MTKNPVNLALIGVPELDFMTQLKGELASAKREILRYRTLLMGDAISIWTTSSDGRMSEILCDDGNEPLGRDPVATEFRMEAVHPDDRASLREVMRHALETSCPFDTTIRAFRANGNPHAPEFCVLRIRGVPVVDDRGQVEEWVGVAIDISVEAHLANQKSELTEQLQEALRAAKSELSQRKRIEAILLEQNCILENIASGMPLKNLLRQIAESLERQLPASCCAILSIDADHQPLIIASPKYPPALQVIADYFESRICDTAKIAGKSIFVTDIATDARFRDVRDAVLAHGLRYCWTVAISAPFDEEKGPGSALGALVLFWADQSTPSSDDWDLVSKIVRLAAIAIQREQSQLALMESQETFRQLAASTDNVFWVADATTKRVLYFSSAYKKVFGRDPVEGTSLESFVTCVHPDDRAFFLQTSSEFHSGRPGEFEYRIVRTDGQVRWVFDRWFPILRNDKLWRVVGALQDVTDRVQSQERLAQKSADLLLAIRSSSLGLLAASMSHQINQPLSALGNYAATCQFLLEKIDNGEIRNLLSENLAKLNNAALHAGEIVRQMRNLVHKDKRQRSNLEFHEILNVSLELTGTELKLKHIRVEREWCKGQVIIYGDAVELQQVVISILTNSVDALTDLPPVERLIRIRTEIDEDALHCTFTDTGPGFSPEIRDHLFEPFVSTKPHGSGIGLTICRNIMNEHGGSIVVDNVAEGGAAVLIRLPIMV